MLHGMLGVTQRRARRALAEPGRAPRSSRSPTPTGKAIPGASGAPWGRWGVAWDEDDPPQQLERTGSPACARRGRSVDGQGAGCDSLGDNAPS